jgi:hypothetical protein
MKLHFGIPHLDDLVRIPLPPTLPDPSSGQEEKLSEVRCATSLAILGPDGAGKSVLALHLASRYLADCWAMYHRLGKEGKLGDGWKESAKTAMPLVLYVSSDFKHDSARSVWEAFGLNRPNTRQIPFERTADALERFVHKNAVIELRHVIPSDNDDGKQQAAVNFLLRRPFKGGANSDALQVGFIDLAGHTAGDDWNFTNSLLTKLPSLERFSMGEEIEPIPHLVIVDSVAGFETYMGDVDSYGLKQTRRARIAQSLRNAGDSCHLVYVVEEPKDQERLPEEYVTDVVIRLRTHREDGTALRTVEVEKARARNHALGEHPYEIRSAQGSSTGNWENPDAPRSKNAYVQIFHSLTYRNAIVAMAHSKGKSKGKETVSPFGIHYLDQLLSEGTLVSHELDRTRPKLRGLRSGSTTGMVGANSTGKSVLTEKFIAESFRVLLEDAVAVYAALVSASPTNENAAAGQRSSIQRTGLSIAQPILALDDPGLYRSADIPSFPSTIDRFSISTFLTECWDQGNRSSHEVVEQHGLERKHDPESKLSEASARAVYSDLRQRAEALRELSYHTRPDRQLTAETREPRSKTNLSTIIDPPGFGGSSPYLGAPETLKRLFRHPNLHNPGVLLTTGDRTTDFVADRCYQHLEEGLNKLLAGYGSFPADALRQTLKEILREQIIVRRFDVARITAPELFHVIQHNVIEAHRLVHGVCFPFLQSRRARKADRIRLVIDDLKVLASLCPDIQTDSAFLPFLTFFLEREGVTSILVHTDSVRPFSRPTDSFTQVLQPLLKHTILTWGVPFRGRNRIAISVVPPAEQEHSGIVRELVLPDDTKSIGEFPKVNRDFELYSGVEEGNPRLVPLAVFIYAATPSFRKYIDQEDLMFRMQFSPMPGGFHGETGRVLWPVDANTYFGIRDITHLPWDATADHTIVDQVDGFWSLDAERGSLASQRDYLMAESPESNQDTFHLFSGKFLDFQETKATDRQGWWERRKFFQNSGYKSRIVDFAKDNPLDTPDRVPFTWDFSFLLIPAAAWDSARVEDSEVGKVMDALRAGPQSTISWRQFAGACKTVAGVTRRERADRPIPFDFACTSAETLASMFLEIWLSEYDLEMRRSDASASRKTAWAEWITRLSNPVYRPHCRSEAGAGNSFSLKELLGSNIVKGIEAFSDAYKETYLQLSRGDVESWTAGMDDPNKMADVFDLMVTTTVAGDRYFKHLDIGALCLYKTWLLLLDILDFNAVLDHTSPFEMQQPKMASPHAMAARHYYRTACEQQQRMAEVNDAVLEGHYALGMPGIYSVRGDSFLASPQASRSKLIASHAMDLLCSRRANITRMQMGLGLPVRDVLEQAACRRMPTALRVRTIDSTKPHLGPPPRYALNQITYEDLCDLGGEPNFNVNSPDGTRRWLYRNAIPEYDRVSRALQRWLIRLFQWTISFKASSPAGWKGGLEAYDALQERRAAPLIIFYDNLHYFGQLCDYLRAEIHAAERKE